MSRLPSLDARRLERVLLRLGFQIVRRRGSHVFYRHPDGRTTTVPHHAGRDIARPPLRGIPREIKLTPDELRRELES